MKLKRLEGESDYAWSMRQIDHNLDESERNLNKVAWIFKWLLIPMWLFLIIIWTIRALSK